MSVGGGKRSRSKIEHLKLDQTVRTELEYLNMLPADLSRCLNQDVNESSFLRNIEPAQQQNE